MSTIIESRDSEKHNSNAPNGDAAPRHTESRSEDSSRTRGAETAASAEYTAEQAEAVKRWVKYLALGIKYVSFGLFNAKFVVSRPSIIIDIIKFHNRLHRSCVTAGSNNVDCF